MFVSAIVAAGGAGRRLGAARPKQLLDIGGGSMLQHSVLAFLAHPRVSEIVIVKPAGPLALAFPQLDPARLQLMRTVDGGGRRQDSVANGFDAWTPSADIVLVHDAARPFISASLIDQTIDAAATHGAAIVALQSKDTVKRVEAGIIVDTIPREQVYLTQTPQGFRREVLAAAVAIGRSGIEATDEAALAERAGYRVHVVDGDPGNVKITTEEDLETARARIAQRGGRMHTGRVGTGYDLHRLVEGRPLVIGGVTIPFDK